MPSGLQIFNADGSLHVDITDKLPKFAQSFVTGTTPGSVTIASQAGNAKMFFSCVPDGSGFYPNGVSPAYGPNIYMEGNTLRWDWDGVPDTLYKCSSRVIVGFF